MGNDAIKAAKKSRILFSERLDLFWRRMEKYYFIEMIAPYSSCFINRDGGRVDLVREQIRIAAHLKLNYKQSDIELKGTCP